MCLRLLCLDFDIVAFLKTYFTKMFSLFTSRHFQKHLISYVEMIPFFTAKCWSNFNFDCVLDLLVNKNSLTLNNLD